MSGTFAAALLLSASLAAGTPLDGTPARAEPGVIAQDDARAQAERAIADAVAAIKAQDLPLAARMLDARMQARGFGELPEDLRYRLTMLAGHLAAERERPEDARRLLDIATAFEQADANDWYARTDAALALGDTDDAARALTRLLRKWPEEAAHANEFAVHRILTGVRQAGHEAVCRDFLQSLFDAGWTPRETHSDEYRVLLARLLLADGKIADAAKAVGPIDDPRQVAAMRVDRRFDALAKRDAVLFDVKRAIERTAAKDRRRVRDAPERLAPLTMQHANQLDALQAEQVIASADRVIALVRDRNGSALYKDFDEQYVWVLDQRAEALARLGRWDEALRQREAAARRPERGGMNVSQVINLAELYNQLGRVRDARDAVGEIGSMSPYGRMQLELVRLRAAVALGDDEATSTALDFLRTHRADAIGAWQDALIVTGNLDAAADLLIERLGRDDWRGDALLAVQDWAPTPRTPMLEAHEKAWKQVIARPSVLAAIARVGRIERFPLATQRH